MTLYREDCPWIPEYGTVAPENVPLHPRLADLSRNAQYAIANKIKAAIRQEGNCYGLWASAPLEQANDTAQLFYVTEGGTYHHARYPDAGMRNWTFHPIESLIVMGPAPSTTHRAWSQA